MGVKIISACFRDEMQPVKILIRSESLLVHISEGTFSDVAAQ